jgi:hypothetical protein
MLKALRSISGVEFAYLYYAEKDCCFNTIHDIKKNCEV